MAETNIYVRRRSHCRTALRSRTSSPIQEDESVGRGVALIHIGGAESVYFISLLNRGMSNNSIKGSKIRSLFHTKAVPCLFRLTQVGWIICY